jgi:hypothetical protein
LRDNDRRVQEQTKDEAYHQVLVQRRLPGGEIWLEHRHIILSIHNLS